MFCPLRLSADDGSGVMLPEMLVLPLLQQARIDSVFEQAVMLAVADEAPDEALGVEVVVKTVSSIVGACATWFQR